MKFFLTLTNSFFWFIVIMAFNKDEAGEMYHKDKVVRKCINTTNASDADIKLIDEGKFPETKEGKCFIACRQGRL